MTAEPAQDVGGSSSRPGCAARWPPSTAATFVAASSAMPVRVSMVALPRCGTSSTFSSGSRSGCTTGSRSKTSSAAPAIMPSRNAPASAASSTIGPRAVFTRYAVCFIRRMAPSLIRWRVSGRSGTCSETTSDVANASSIVTTRMAVEHPPPGARKHDVHPERRGARSDRTADAAGTDDAELLPAEFHAGHEVKRPALPAVASNQPVAFGHPPRDAQDQPQVNSATAPVSTSGVLVTMMPRARAAAHRRCCSRRPRWRRSFQRRPGVDSSASSTLSVEHGDDCVACPATRWRSASRGRRRARQTRRCPPLEGWQGADAGIRTSDEDRDGLASVPMTADGRARSDCSGHQTARSTPCHVVTLAVAAVITSHGRLGDARRSC